MMYLTLILLIIVLMSFVGNINVKVEQKTQKEKQETIIEVEEKEVYTKMKATAYTAGFESTGKNKGDKSYGITASGKVVTEGKTIACPKNMEFGTKLYVKEMKKTYVCEDRGSAITNGRIDIYIASLDEALEFGVRDVNVLVK